MHTPKEGKRRYCPKNKGENVPPMATRALGTPLSRHWREGQSMVTENSVALWPEGHAYGDREFYDFGAWGQYTGTENSMTFAPEGCLRDRKFCGLVASGLSRTDIYKAFSWKSTFNFSSPSTAYHSSKNSETIILCPFRDRSPGT